MRTLLRLGLALGAAGWLAACSSDGETPRPGEGGGATALAGTGGAGANGAGQGGGVGGVGGSGAGGASGAGGVAGPRPNLGAQLEFVPGTGPVPYAIAENAYGIVGGAFLARSALGNTIIVGDTPGQICISGNLEEVPAGNYGQYWGVEVGFNLNQGAADTAPPPSTTADAGADAAATDAGAVAVPEVAQPWVPGNVIGFSFVIEGPTIDLIRFKALPAGYDSALESSVFCKTINAVTGVPQDALFSEMTQYCWGPSPVLLPTGPGLANISWQLPADVAIGARPFDWCLKELRPILAD